jgi:pimeloyl-ACP methyl ester carboxylesterase
MQIERGVLGGLPFAAVGEGEPLVVLAGLSPATGVDGSGTVRSSLGPLLRLAKRRRLVLINRRAGLPRGMTMGELAAEHADGISEGLGTPVDVAGISTGGSIAQQLAADRPEVVRRLVLASTACRLGPEGRELQRRVAARVRAGADRQAYAVMAAGLVPPYRGRTAAAVAAWLAGPRLLSDTQGLADMATTIEAEDGFDLALCRSPIRAPTLILAGGDDRFYSTALFEETARLIGGSELHVLGGRGHITVMSDGRFHARLAAFLDRS